MEKLKIGVICYPSLGGSGIVATELGTKMAERGHEIHYITSSKPFRLSESNSNIFFHEVTIDGYAVFKYPPYDIALANRIAQVIVEEKLDLLHVHYAVPHAVSAALAKDMAQSSIGVITTLHGTDVTILGYDPALKNTLSYGINKSTVTTAVSESLRKETMELIKPTNEIVTIYNFIDEERYHTVETGNLRQELGIPHNDKVLIHISNFRKVKRIQDVIKSFEKINTKIESTLILAGEGPEEDEMKKLVDSLGLQDKVIFTGKRDDLPELLSISDLMLHLSEKEAFGLVLLEALACGVTSIATDTGGIPEVIKNGVNGFIVPIGDVNAVVENALNILNNDELRERLSRNGLETAQVKFNSNKIVSEYEKLYYEVAGKR